MYNEKVFFQKAKCLVKTVEKCFLKKLSVWLTLIKIAVLGINYQKGQWVSLVRLFEVGLFEKVEFLKSA